jgi:hypothetical protein
MSTGLWVRDSSGISRKAKKLYVRDSSGTVRKLKSLWARDPAGVNRKIFSGAVIWTGCLESEYTLSFTGYYTGGGGYYDYYVTTVIDIENLEMKAGETINFAVSTNILRNDSVYEELHLTVEINGATVATINNPSSSYSQNYVIPEDEVINTISLNLRLVTFPGKETYGRVKATVNSAEYGSFLLNNSGTSDQ